MPSPKRRPFPPAVDEPATTRRPKRISRPKPESLVERVNALPLADFSTQFFPPETLVTFASASASVTPSSASARLHLLLMTWTEMPSSQREACLDLIEQTSSSYYRASELGWSRAKKTREMRHPAMKYLLLLPLPPPRSADDEGKGGDGGLLGFLSFMITDEDGREVVYCYELHLRLGMQGQGWGKRMMEVMEGSGGRVGVQKAMLTVFRSNERAVKAYGKWGYGVDEFSPEAWRLRNGAIKEPGYVILSKAREEFA